MVYFPRYILTKFATGHKLSFRPNDPELAEGECVEESLKKKIKRFLGKLGMIIMSRSY